MTTEITQALIDAHADRLGIRLCQASALAKALGITVKRDPPEAMMALASAAGTLWVKSEDGCIDPRSAFSRGYLAALQYMERAVRDAPGAPGTCGDYINRRAMLKAIGANV